MAPTKTLLLDGRTLSCLAFARSLGDKTNEIHVGESFRGSLTAFSRFSSEQWVYPSPEDEGQFVSELTELIATEGYDFVIPMRDVTTLRLAGAREQLADYRCAPFAPIETIAELNDKERCARLAERVGVRTPRTHYPSETAIAEIADAASFPVLVKPARSSGSRGIVRVERPERLASTYEAVADAHGPAIIQEFVDHAGGHFSVGTVFDRESEPCAVHVYEELRQYPDSGGPAIEAVSVDVEPWVDEMLDILRAVNWVGPAHMDILLDPSDGRHKLLEVNPRIWMSIALTIRSGVDVPRIVRAVANGDRPEPVTSYRTGLRYRWVLPNELLWAVSGDDKLTRFRRLLNPPRGRACYGVLSRRDPLATVGTATQSAQFLRDEEKRRAILGRGW
jgi:predicted ATP-grasp superfamily ATP-dependent carboligase